MPASHVCITRDGRRFEKPSSLLYYQDGPPTSVDIQSWRLRLIGQVPRPLELSYPQLLDLPPVTESRRAVCICNWSVRHEYTGVRLAHVLEMAGLDRPRADALMLLQTSIGTPEKGQYQSTVPLQTALQRNAMICYAIDGAPLSLERGYPARFIDFGLYLYKCVKGLSSLEVTPEYRLSYWEERAGWPLDGTIRPKRYWFCDLKERRYVEKEGEIDEF
ncbi:MAG TPA: molybdopterin-dependent oxidoreductase [Polyangia bacterium]|nr:molybdopterin-dependent oxidoreductase [Polyangia bacterium]